MVLSKFFIVAPHPDDNRSFATIYCLMARRVGMRHQKAFQSTISDSQGQVSSKIIGWFMLSMVIVTNSNQNKHFSCVLYDGNQFP